MVKEEKQSNVSEKNKNELGLLEEDDEFEEFPVDNWEEDAEASDETTGDVWEDNWDDDNIEDDFYKMLKKELEETKKMES
ncbi:hypothetical protein QYM36_000629 [Artemia franciscana]|uniref:26S proteasome complex subunit SEM1 n=1 Tax=Artemia franciscana TaxID=6661 RepID=A0AA88LJM3_ARTSF|nr:hypothetical protein QYM36_000629 [Artemia franciscana]